MIYKLHCFVLFFKTKASFLKLEFIVIKKENKKKKTTSHKKKKNILGNKKLFKPALEPLFV